MSASHPTPPGLRREQPIQKAARLMSEDRVHLAPSARVYVVDGDTGAYRVIADADGIFCPCPARGPLCAHVLAVAQVRLRDGVFPSGLLADLGVAA